MNWGSTQKCMTVEKNSGNHTLWVFLCCWAFWYPQRAGSSMDFTRAWLLWTHPRLPEEDQGFKWNFFLLAPQSAPSIPDQLWASSQLLSLMSICSHHRLPRENKGDKLWSHGKPKPCVHIDKHCQFHITLKCGCIEGEATTQLTLDCLFPAFGGEWYGKLQECKRNLRWVFTSRAEAEREKQGKYFWKVPSCIYWPHEITAMVLCQNLELNVSSSLLLMYGCDNTDVGRRQPPVSHCTASCRICLSTVGIPLHCWASVPCKNHPPNLVWLGQSTNKPCLFHAGKMFRVKRMWANLNCINNCKSLLQMRA